MGAAQAPQRVWAEPGRQTHLGSRKRVYNSDNIFGSFVWSCYMYHRPYDEEAIASSCLNVYVKNTALHVCAYHGCDFLWRIVMINSTVLSVYVLLVYKNKEFII